MDAQELDILDEIDDERIRDDLTDDNLDGIISKIEAVQRTPPITDTAAPKRGSEEEQNNDDMVRSPQKVNQTANTQTGLPPADRGNSCRCN